MDSQLYSIGLHYYLMPVSHCINYFKFVVCSEIGKYVSPPNLLLFSKVALTIWVLLQLLIDFILFLIIHMDFMFILSTYAKMIHGMFFTRDFDIHHIEPVDYFGDYNPLGNMQSFISIGFLST